MNPAHLKAFLWLRWRLVVNQFRRSGPGGVALAGIVAALTAAAVVLTLTVGFFAGLMGLRTAPARAVMFVWDGAIVGFVFLWFVGLMSELQRMDAISLDRFLHLPVSPSSAFVINFIGSSVSLGLVLILPAMIGLATGMTLSRGAGMLVLFPLIAAFFLMMTALAYQFRGWLAAMMQNPKRRQTILFVVPALFILTFQLPNLWNNVGPGAQARREASAERRRVISKLDEDRAAGRITIAEYGRRRRELSTDTTGENDKSIRLVNMVVPPGWLAYGAESAANGRQWPAWAGIVGMGLIGTISLRRAYGTTLRLYRGDFDRGRRQVRSPGASVPSVKAARSPGEADTSRPMLLLERRLPFMSERVSSVAMASLRAWLRRPEMKMTLLTPIFMLLAFSRTFTSGGDRPELMRLLMTVGVTAFVLIIGLVGPVGNQFGYDRSGFRAFVLSPMQRRDVLIGKNLAMFPFALPMMLVPVALAQWFTPLRPAHFVGLMFQLVSMFLMFCLAANLLSIMGPLEMKQGSGMPAPRQGIRNLGHLLFMLLSPLVLGLTLLPLGAEALFSYLNWFPGFPAYLVLGTLQAVGTVLLYRRVLDWQGELLQRREQRILEIVGSKSK